MGPFDKILWVPRFGFWPYYAARTRHGAWLGGIKVPPVLRVLCYGPGQNILSISINLPAHFSLDTKKTRFSRQQSYFVSLCICLWIFFLNYVILKKKPNFKVMQFCSHNITHQKENMHAWSCRASLKLPDIRFALQSNSPKNMNLQLFDPWTSKTKPLRSPQGAPSSWKSFWPVSCWI